MKHLCYTDRAEIGLLCGFSFNARQLNIVQYLIRPLSASAASAGFSKPADNGRTAFKRKGGTMKDNKEFAERGGS